MHIKGDETLIKIQLWKVSWFVCIVGMCICVSCLSLCVILQVCTAVYRTLCVCVYNVYTVIIYT